MSHFRDPALRANLTANLLVSTVLMATLVVGPFYLSIGLGLGMAWVGLVASAGPLVAAVSGVPSGQLVDRFGARRMVLVALGGLAAGALVLAGMPRSSGVTGYTVPMVLVTASYALFQAANNTAVLQGIEANERGVLSGTLNLSRNLGLITGTCVMGALFAAATGTHDVTTAPPDAVAFGMRMTFGVAAALLLIAGAILMRANPHRETRLPEAPSLSHPQESASPR